MQRAYVDFSETKDLWQVTHNPENEEQDGEKREESGKGRFISFFWQLIFKTLQYSCQVISGKEQRRSGDDTVVIDISDISLVALQGWSRFHSMACVKEP